MNKCKQCNEPYEAIKATSRYCSAKCRVAANRAGSVTVTPLSVTPEPSGSVTRADPVTLRITDPVSVTEPTNWADPDADYSTIARKTQGAVLVLGDPGYKGVCVEVDGVWQVRQTA